MADTDALAAERIARYNEKPVVQVKGSPGVLLESEARSIVRSLIRNLPNKYRAEYEKLPTFVSLFDYWNKNNRLTDRMAVALATGEFVTFQTLARAARRGKAASEDVVTDAELNTVAGMYLPSGLAYPRQTVILKAYYAIFSCCMYYFPDEVEFIEQVWDVFSTDRLRTASIAVVPEEVVEEVEEDTVPEFGGDIGAGVEPQAVMEGVVEDPDLDDLLGDLEGDRNTTAVKERQGLVASTALQAGQVARKAAASAQSSARAAAISARRAAAAAPINVADAIPDRGIPDAPRTGASDLPRRSLAEQITRLPPRGNNRYRNSDKFRTELVNTRDQPGCFAKSSATTYDPKMGIIRAKYRPGPKPGSAAAAGSSRRISMINRLRRGEQVSLEEAMAAGLKRATAERLIARGAQPKRVPPRGARPTRTAEQRDAEAISISRAAAGFAAGAQIRAGGRLGNDPFRLASRIVRAPAQDNNQRALAYLIRKEAAAKARKQLRRARAEAAAREAGRYGRQGGRVVRRPTTTGMASSLLGGLSKKTAK